MFLVQTCAELLTLFVWFHSPFVVLLEIRHRLGVQRTEICLEMDDVLAREDI